MPAFDIKEATPADLALLEGRAEVPPHAIRELRARPGRWRGIAAFHRGRLVGFRAAKVLELSASGDRFACGVLTACFLEETYRSGGVHSAFMEMDETFEAMFEGREAGRFAVVVGRVAESDFWTLRRMRNYTPVRSDVDFVLDDPAAARVAKSSDAAVVLDAAALSAWTEPILTGEISTVRDGAEIAARAIGGRALAVFGGGRPRAVAVVRDEGETRDVVDWAVPEGDVAAADALLGAILEGAAGPVRFPVFGRSPWLLRFQRAGFRARPAARGGVVEPLLSGRAAIPRLAPDKLGEFWFATDADVSREPLPPCGLVEDVVDPPPAGTRSGRDAAG